MLKRIITNITLALGIIITSVAHAQTTTTAQPADYTDPAVWLCRPDIARNACDFDNDVTVVNSDGSTRVQPWRANPNAAVDCFYVYPTVSNDRTPNSDLNAGPEEIRVAQAQLSRYGSLCRTFAPLYRQNTLAALRGQVPRGDTELLYNDVKNAWNTYLERWNDGRGVVLMGHSQGASVLNRLIREEIDGKPIQDQLISALLLGSNVAVPRGRDVGGDFKNIPLCRSMLQTGCLISFVTFRDDVPPPANTRFGKVKGEGMIAACTNPALLTSRGGIGVLKPIFPTDRTSAYTAGQTIEPWVNPPVAISTPWVTTPNFLTAQCVDSEKGSYLAVTAHPNPGDARTDVITGDIFVQGKRLDEWGLHVFDTYVGQGNLMDVVGQQIRSYLRLR